MNDLPIAPAYSAAVDTLPQQESFKSKSTKFFKRFSTLSFSANASGSQDYSHPGSASRGNFGFKKMKGYFKRSLVLPLVVLLVFLLIIGAIIYNSLQNSATVTGLETSGDGRVEVKKAKAEQKLNKEFQFPLKDEKGAEVSRLKYFIENAELRDEIIVKGKRAKSVSGRTFLIINVKITNDFAQPITLKSRDYVRLIVNNSTEKLAPDIHNDPVEIQAISTKYTRLGFPINDTDKNLTLQIGEISGKKETIKLNVQ